MLRKSHTIHSYYIKNISNLYESYWFTFSTEKSRSESFSLFSMFNISLVFAVVVSIRDISTEI